MKFLDLKGLQDLWSKVLKTRTEVEASNENGALITIAATESTVTGSDGLGKKFTISLGGLENVASKAGLEALYGGEIPASDAITMSDLDDRIGDLESGSVVTVEKQATAESGYAATYVVKQNDDQVGVKINIPKDFLVRSAELKVAAATDNIPDVATGEKYIDFVINTPGDDATDSHVYLPINDLVDTYTGENGVAIDSSTNKVSGVVDSTSETFLTVGADGFKLTGVQAAINSAKSDVIGASTDAASADTINGAKAYADSIVAAKNVTATGDSYVSASASNNEVTVAATQSTKDSLALADSAIQGVDSTPAGTNVQVTLGKSGKNVTVAVDETGLDTALAGKVDKVEGSSLMTQAEHEKLAAVEADADVNIIETVKVDNVALTPDANKAVNIDLSGKTDKVTSATSGNFAGLDANGNLTDSGSKAADFATAAQGALAKSAIQSVTGETDITGGNDELVAVTTSTNASNAVTLASKVKTQAVATAVASTADGLATAADVKSYVDGKTTIATHTETAAAPSGTTPTGTMVVSSVTTENGGVTAVGSVEVEALGAAAAAKTELLGDATANGNTLGKLEDRLDAIEGSGSGSISDQINAKVATLDSDVDAATATTNHVATTPASNNGTTSAHVTAAKVLTSLTITDGLFSAATSQTIEAIDDDDLASILVAPSAQSGE